MNPTLLPKRMLALAVFLCALLPAVAQHGPVRGHVFDADGKTPLVGVTVLVEGTQTGTVTGRDGAFTITPPRGVDTVVLNFSYLGYEDHREPAGVRTNVDVKLKPRVEQIDEVVVTALGLTREQKALGYAVSKVDNEDLTASVSNNWLNAMSGKVAGLNFDHASSGPGGSIRVTLRGESSVNLNNNTALFVIDGVPMMSGMVAIGGAAYNNDDAAVDYGNGASDINPEDVESVSVLKGPAATALYGSRAGNGAIVITTKSGMKTKGLGISFSSNFSFEKAGFWPDFQDTYGPGNGQNFYSFYNVKADESTTGEAASRTYSRFTWGPRFEGQNYYQWASLDHETGMYTPLPFVPRDWYKGFFETGATYKNSVAISGNNGKGGSLRVSFTDTRNTWIVPNTGYNSQSIAASFSQQFKFIKVAGKVNYYRKDSDNLPMTGYSTASPTYTLMWSRNNIDVDWYRYEFDHDLHGRTLSINALSDNPYMQAYEQLNTLDRDRVYGNVNVEFRLWRDLKLMLRSGMDMDREFRTRQKPKGSKSSVEGFYREQTATGMEMNHDFLLTYARDWERFHLSVNLGGNSMYQEERVVTATASQLLTDNVYNLNNALSSPVYRVSNPTKSVNSLYGMVQFGYDDFLFVDLTARNDWSSTLARDRWSYFYPSVSASLVLTDWKRLGLRSSLPWLNFLKLRASWANVGNDTSPFVIDNYYATTDFSSGYLLPSTWALHEMKPENIESWEFGLEAKLFRNRWTFDAAFYNNITTNQIIPVPVDWSTGVSAKYINAGKVRNRGIEISSRIRPLRGGKNGVNWDIDLTWSKNWNKVLELAPGVDRWVIASGPRGEVSAEVGGTLGDLWGYGYKKAEAGSYILNRDGSRTDVSGKTVVDDHGYPVLETNSDKMEYLGNVQPDWRAGLSTSLSYKGFRVSLSFAGQWGGVAYSLTHAQLSSQGKLTNTLYGRYGGVLHEGVVAVGMDAQGNTLYRKNTQVSESAVTYYRERVYAMNNVRNNTFSTSYLKLREARIEYNLPKKWLARTGFIQGASLAVFGTNLFCWSKWPFYDPEVGTMNGSNIMRGFETASYPMTRTYGLNIKLQF